MNKYYHYLNRSLWSCLFVASAAAAELPEFEFSEQDYWAADLHNTFMLALGYRVENPDKGLIGKVSLLENRDLCVKDDCIGLAPNETEPNERFLAAPGLLSSNTDDGNLNYQAGDPVLGFIKWNSKISGNYKVVEFELSWLALFDYVNTDFEESYTNVIVEEGPQPGISQRRPRPKETEDAIGNFIELRTAFIKFPIAMDSGREADIKIGRQLLNWGESAFVLRGNLNFINPYETNNLFRPGFDLEEIYRPVGLVSFDIPLSDTVMLQGFYQFEWRPYGLPAKGSVYSFLDAGNEVTENETVVLPFAKTPNDPDQLGLGANPIIPLVSATSFSARRGANQEARDQGQLGIGLRIQREDWFQGTELAFFIANYHTRIPSISAYAANASCTRAEGNSRGSDSTNLVDFIADCGIPVVEQPDEKFEALPIDSFKYFLEYPEDIHLLGATFSSDVGNMLIGGELAYRYNQPVQVDLEDVIFAAVQPAFPRETLVLVPGTIPGLLAATLADSEVAAPDYLTKYRGGTPGEIAPNQYIRGYESMETVQLTLTATKLFANDNRLFGANEFAVLAELQGIWLPGIPDLDELQFEGPGTHTHYSPGIAETGNALLFNPIQNRDGYVDEFSWGYRLTLIANYKDFPMKGVSMRPLIVWLHDIEGVSPGLAENFLEGRQIGIFQFDFRRDHWTLGTTYNYFGGGEDRNAFRDRDFMSIYLKYEL